MTYDEFMALDEGEYVSFGKSRCQVRGKNGLGEPRIVFVVLGIEMNGAVYASHLLRICEAPPPEPVEETSTDETKK